MLHLGQYRLHGNGLLSSAEMREDELADGFALLVDIAREGVALTHIAVLAAVIDVFAKVVEELHEATFLVVLDVVDHRADTLLLSRLTVLVDDVRDA